jgi:DNA polymerase I-like protein with 3'-5' exonuclease and polymerase domains
VRDINESKVLKTLHNGSYDASYFVRDLLGLRNWFLDSMVLWWSLYMELPKKLQFVTSVLCDNYQFWKDDIKGDEQDSVDVNAERYWRYNGLDTYYTLFDTCYLVSLLMKNKAMQFNYRDAMLRVFSGLAMSLRGMGVDWKRRDYLRDKLEEELQARTEEFRFIIDEPEFNINSSDQKKSLIYDVFGLRERNARGRFVDHNKPLKGTNAPSAGKIPLKMAKSEHPLFKYILDKLEAAMEPRVQLSNVFGYKQEDGKVKGGYFMPTGRLRTSFSAVGTETTRFASKKSSFWDGGNLQNIRGEYKDWIRADEGKILLDVDYSQSDDVFMAYESQDPDKIAIVESGADAHAVNGELFFGTPYDDIVAGKRNGDPRIVHPIFGIRQLSKRIVHGTNFQMAAMTLYVTMGREAVIEAARLLGTPNPDALSQDQLIQVCGKLMSFYRKKYKRLTAKEYYKEISQELETKRAITNCFGITRNFLGDPKDNGTQREATAFIAQSATGSNMNRVMYEIDHAFIPEEFRDGPNPHKREKPLMMTRKSHGFAFHLQVHDNFVSQLDTRHPRWKEAAANLLTVMNRPVLIHGRLVSIRAEAEVGTHWGKHMTPWDGKDVNDLDRISVSLLTQERMKA